MLVLPALVLAALAGCARNYSPNTYSSAAAQQANKVTRAIVVGVREVAISADGTVGTITGGAAGGVLGAQVPSGGIGTALGTVGGTLLGGLIGATAEHAAGDTTAFEYIVRQTDGELLSVTQKDATPLAMGEKVLVIAGNQARIVRDYSLPAETPTVPTPETVTAKETTPAKEAPVPEAAASPPAADSSGSAAAPDGVPPQAPPAAASDDGGSATDELPGMIPTE